MMNLILGWMLGVLSSLGGAFFIMYGVARDLERRSDPPTKEDWKVM